MNYYKRHLGDYARCTGHLSALENGIYNLLLDFYYSSEKPIPKEKAHRIAKANPEETQTVCEEFFVSDGQTWRHNRADREIAEYHDKAETNKQNGTKGGRPATQNKPIRNPKETQSVISGNPIHKPLTINQEPLANSHEPMASNQEPESKETSKALRKATPREPSQSKETWQSYSEAYQHRYGTPPVRNATVNGQLANFVKRVGAEEAPAIASFYVGHNSAFYVGRGHAIGNLLADAEKLRTEWATGRQVTQTRARQLDQTASNPFLEILADRKRERLENAQ